MIEIAGTGSDTSSFSRSRLIFGREGRLKSLQENLSSSVNRLGVMPVTVRAAKPIAGMAPDRLNAEVLSCSKGDRTVCHRRCELAGSAQIQCLG